MSHGHDEMLPPARNARGLAAADWGVPVDAITVETVEAVDWPDASLGVPEPGMMYAQVITPGYRIRVRAGNRARVYHADRASRIVLAGEETVDA